MQQSTLNNARFNSLLNRCKSENSRAIAQAEASPGEQNARGTSLFRGPLQYGDREETVRQRQPPFGFCIEVRHHGR